MFWAEAGGQGGSHTSPRQLLSRTLTEGSAGLPDLHQAHLPTQDSPGSDFTGPAVSPAAALPPPTVQARPGAQGSFGADPLRGREGARRAKAPGPASCSSGRGGHTGLSPNGPARRLLTLSCPTSRRNRSRFRAPPPERAAALADAMRPLAPKVGAGRVAAARSSSPSSASVLPLR